MTKNTSYNCNGAMTAIGHAHTKLGTTAPHTDEPWSEAMLFGLSGGVGQGYILWEFKKDSSAPLVLGFVHRWNYPAERLEHAGTRSGLNVTTTNTGSATKAEALLSEQLAKGIPSAVLTDWLHCPYAWYLTIDDEADGIFTARDTGKSPLAIPAEMLSAARAEVPSYKNALIGFSKGKRVSKTALKGNIKAAITDAVAYQSTSSDSFSLKALRKWSRALTDKEMAKSWPTVLGDGRNLLPALITVYQRPKLTGTDGKALRGLYADFLEEAHAFTKCADLADAASAYRKAGKAWVKLANTALPNDVPELAAVRALVDKRANAQAAGGAKTVAKIEALSRQIDVAIKASRTKFPLNKPDRLALFADLKMALDAVIEAEQNAIDALAKAAANL